MPHRALDDARHQARYVADTVSALYYRQGRSADPLCPFSFTARVSTLALFVTRTCLSCYAKVSVYASQPGAARPIRHRSYLPTIPAIAVGLGSSEALIQSTISLFILVLGLGQVIAGPLVDNYGRKPVALAGIILYMIGAAMAALATSPTVFIASRLLQG